MLPFGSITSIIPLFVLGFAYLLYFSTALLSKPEDHAIDRGAVSEKKEITFNTDHQVRFPVVSISANQDYPSNSAEAVENIYINAPGWLAVLILPPILQKPELKPCYFHSSVRPPPVF